MTRAEYFLIMVLWAGAIAWQLRSRKAFGTIWEWRIRRDDSPAVYWIMVIAQAGFFVAYLRNGRSWFTH